MPRGVWVACPHQLEPCLCCLSNVAPIRALETVNGRAGVRQWVGQLGKGGWLKRVAHTVA